MTILDYTKDLTMFDSYDKKIINMLINELKLRQLNEFNFLKDFSLNEIELFWYKDHNDGILGGFHMPGKNVIYINEVNIQEMKNDHYFVKMQRIISAFPTIMHEICHYCQFKKNELLYLFLQFPIIRYFTIQKEAYKVSEYLYENNNFQYMSPKQLVQYKISYDFDKIYFDEFQKKLMSK